MSDVQRLAVRLQRGALVAWTAGTAFLALVYGAITNAIEDFVDEMLREGCIPALSNTTTRDATLSWAFADSPSTVNPDRVMPQTVTETPVGTIELPEFWETVKSLDQVTEVDYFVPGCPPQAHQIWGVLEAGRAFGWEWAARPGLGSSCFGSFSPDDRQWPIR